MKTKPSKAGKERIKAAKLIFPNMKFKSEEDKIKTYRKIFSVDKSCALKELNAGGLLSREASAAYQKSLENRQKANAARRERKKANKAKREAEQERRRLEKKLGNLNEDQDEYFYFIAGYTSGGAPFGITWEEAASEGMLSEEEIQEHFGND